MQRTVTPSSPPTQIQRTNLLSSNITPHEGQGSPYTLPAVQLPDGTVVMDSLAIAQKLESLHPSPSLHLDNGLHLKVGPIFGKIGAPLLPVFMPRIGRDVIVESSVPYFQEARKKAFGMSLDEFEKMKGGEQAWQAAQPGVEDLKAFLAEHKQDDGPFVLGSQVSYVDFVIVAFMEAFRRIGEELFERLVGNDESLRNIHKACERWLENDQ